METGLLEYVKWRGDLSFDQSPFNEVDMLILTQIAYLPFEGIVPSRRSKRLISLKHAANMMFGLLHDMDTHLGVLLPGEIYELFHKMSDTRRYGGLLMGNYMNRIEEKEVMQFGAMTFFNETSSEIYLVFRGTDDTIVGWQEDLSMSFMNQIPAQQEAVDYTNHMLEKCNEGEPKLCKIWIGGHSKGGNLAVYAAAFSYLSAKHLDRICRIFNFDGPGFGHDILQSKEYERIRDKVVAVVPEGALVGLLLEHDEAYGIVKSSKHGIRQHDAMTWMVDGTSLCYVERMTDSSEALNCAMKKWLQDIHPYDARNIVDIIFRTITATDARTLTELLEGGNKNLMVAVRAYMGENTNNKRMIREFFRMIYREWKENVRKIHKNKK